MSGPVVFCYAGPEYPDEYYREKVEKNFKHATIYLAIRTSTYVYRGNELEDLSYCEKHRCQY
jgi:hypothetical protein